nr:putative ribonuclease H-like domain-containing protein [Tanacetum cinerariifolium]
MDVTSAFLYRRIEEEVYVYQPLGFEVPDHLVKVYKVVKALYDLNQAPRSLYETLAKYLLGNGFHRGKIDQTLFFKRSLVILERSMMKFQTKKNKASNEVNSVFENLSTKYPDNPKIPGLETIKPYDDSEVGADFTNLESSIHVCPTPTTRTHKNHPLKQVTSTNKEQAKAY